MPTNKKQNTATAPQSDDVEMMSDKSEAETESETPATVASSNTATPDPFHPSNLRLSQAFTETVGVKKLLTTVPVRKPSPQDFVRTHPGVGYREDFPLIELKDEREEYIVTADSYQ